MEERVNSLSRLNIHSNQNDSQREFDRSMIVGGSQTFSKGMLNMKEKSDQPEEEGYNTITLGNLNKGLHTSNSSITDFLDSHP